MQQADKSSRGTVVVCCSDNYVGGVGARVLANVVMNETGRQVMSTYSERVLQ